MSIRMNKFTFPGCFFCHCKYNKKGNNYHTICYGEVDIMYGWDRDHTIPMGRPQSETIPNMHIVGLILWLTRSLCKTGKAVTMHSCFCVLKGLPEMRKIRSHVISSINKRRYWTRGVHGHGNYYRSKNIGDMGCISD